MARKRKLESRSTEPNQPPKKQQQQQKLEVIEEPKPEEPKPQDDRGEEEEEVEEVEEEEEEYEEVEEEEEDDDDDGDSGKSNAANHVNQTADASASGSAANGDDEDDEEDDDEEEPIPNLLEPFGKEQLVNLLREAADKHEDVADRIRKVADEDPVHRKIFVHGLGWDTNAETLKNAFKQYGEIEECKAVTDKVSGKSKGYGFIVFKKRAGARRALKEPQKKIGNRTTACQLASLGPVPAPSAGPSAVQAAQQPQTPVSEYTLRKIYVSNVGAELEPQKLLTFFAKYGEIEEGPLGLDKLTGKPKGFCLFVYKSSESAKKALEEPHKNFEGHILHCQKAIDGPKPGKSQQHYHHHHNRNQNQNRAQYRRNENPGFVGAGTGAGTGHLMAPGGAGIGFNQGAAAAQALNPALGQALTALLATQGAGLGLTNLLGTTAAVTPGMPGAGHGMQGAYGNQTNISPGVIGGYGAQGAMQGGYPNQQIGQGGSGRGQHGAGQYGGASTYMGH